MTASLNVAYGVTLIPLKPDVETATIIIENWIRNKFKVNIAGTT